VRQGQGVLCTLFVVCCVENSLLGLCCRQTRPS
jgi:hypothetical protein